MKRLYWLPEAERGNTAVYLRRVDLDEGGRWSATLTPGTATPDDAGEPTNFTPDSDIEAVPGTTVQHPAHFTAWFETLERTAATAEGHFVGAVLMYLWLQRRDQLEGLPPGPSS